MGDAKKTDRRGADPPRYTPRAPYDGATMTGPLAGTRMLREVARDPTGPIQRAIALLEKTRRSFKSQDVADARELLEGWVDAVLPPLPSPDIPEGPVALRLDDALARELAARGEVSGAGIKRQLQRYYDLLPWLLTETDFSDVEAMVLYCVVVADPPRPTDIAKAVTRYLERDAARTPTPERDAVLPPAAARVLVEKLERMSEPVLAAVIDACERAQQIYPRPERDLAIALRRVGLVRVK